MSSSLRSRFASAEHHLLSSFPLGEAALSSFGASWLGLVQDFRAAQKLQQVDHQTTLLAQCTASRIHCLTESLLSLHIAAEEVRENFNADIRASIIDEQSIASPPLRSPPELSSHTDTITISYPRAEQGHNPRSLNSTCRDWLLQHLHDPYPSSPVKSALSESCGVPMKDVQDWFADARRHIGWTALSQEMFNGSRRATLEAASRAYSDSEDNGLPLHIRRAFTAIKANAHTLFNDGHTADFPSESQSAPLHASGVGSLVRFSQEDSDEDSGTFIPLSSPHDNHRSASAASPANTSSILSTDEEEDITPPPPIAGCKRRLDMSTGIEDGHGLDLLAVTRPNKRHRYTSLTADTSTFEPSRLNRPDTTSVPFTTGGSPEATVLSPPTVVTSSTPEAPDGIICVANRTPALGTASPRKRRLSDAFAGDYPKRPRGLTLPPRRQMVSDPLPVGLGFVGSEMHALGEWTESNLDTPYAAGLNNVDRFLSYDVELATFTTQSSEATFSTSSLDQVLHPSECHVSYADLVSATLEGFDFSAYNSDVLLASGLDFQLDSDLVTSDGSSVSSPSSAGSCSDLSDYGLTDDNSSQDWNQIFNILDSFGSSSTSSQSSPSDVSPPRPLASAAMPSPSPGEINHILSAADPPFTTLNLLADIGGFSSLHMPLEGIF